MKARSGKAVYEHHEHGFGPVWDQESRILILGSFPSVKSREQAFFYGHPQNRFWKVLGAVTGAETPVTKEEKIRLLLENRIALWDVVESCDIVGSGDSSIRNVVPVDLSIILRSAPIQAIFANGKTAGKLYEKYQGKTCGKPVTVLPSTSPANAVFSLERLTGCWSEALSPFLPGKCQAVTGVTSQSSFSLQ